MMTTTQNPLKMIFSLELKMHGAQIVCLNQHQLQALIQINSLRSGRIAIEPLGSSL